MPECMLSPESGEENLAAHLGGQQNQYQNYRGPDNTAAVSDGQTGSQIMPQNGGDRSNKPHSDVDVAHRQGCEKRLPRLEARLITLTPPAACRVSIFPRRIKISIRKVPVPGP